MKRSDRIFVISVVGGTLATSSIVWLALGVAFELLLGPPSISREQRQVIEKLEKGEYASLEEIQPKPNYIHGPYNVPASVDDYCWKLQYVLKDSSGSLDILLDENLRLISWRVVCD